MRRSRLLIVLPAVGALVFTGLAPASASDQGRDDPSGKVIAIANEAAVSRNGNKVEVEFRYKCDDGDRRNEKVTADVTLKDGGRYEAENVNLRCDDKPRWKTVTLEKEGRGEVEKGDRAKVTVTLSADDDRNRLARESQKVKIEKARRG